MTEFTFFISFCFLVEKPAVMRIARKPSPLQVTIDQKQLENVEYFKHLDSMITNGARCTKYT
jgi:hypothetical protein